MKTWKSLTFWLVATIVIVTGLFYVFRPAAIRVDVANVMRGPIRLTINDDGETRIREKYVISAPITGQLLRVQLHAGDPVEAGKTPIAQIVPSPSSLLDQRTRAELEARLQAAIAAKMQADASLESTIELRDLAEHNYERIRKLIETNSVSRQEADEAEHQAALSRASVRAAEFQSRVRAFEVEQARAALRQIQSESQVDQSNTVTILAPTDGRVLRVIREDMGVVPVGTPIIEIGDPTVLEIVLDILSTEAIRVKPGNTIDIEHWGGDRVLHAKVRRVEPAAFLKVSALGVEEKRVNVIADFSEPQSETSALGDGFRVEGKICIQETGSETLKVSSGAFFRHDAAWHVYRVVQGRAFLTPVETGITSGAETEIRNGLTEGDTVIVYPPQSIRNHVRVDSVR